MSHSILHIIPENIEGKHIPQYVAPASMEKHTAHKRDHIHEGKSQHPTGIRLKVISWNHRKVGVKFHHALLRQLKLIDEGKNIQDDQAPVYYRGPF